MRYIRLLGAAVIALLSVSKPTSAQTILQPISAYTTTQVPEGSVIGPDGTYYALVPSSTSTRQNPSTELMAIGVTGTVKWNVTLSGEIGQVLPGSTDVYVVQTVISGSGKSTTAATSVLVLKALSGTPGTPITPLAGTITKIQEKTANGTDYLYIDTVVTTTSSSGGTTTRTTTDTLSIYSNGILVQSVKL